MCVFFSVSDQDSLSPESHGLRASPDVSPIVNGSPRRTRAGTDGGLPNGGIHHREKESTPTPDRESLHIEDDVAENNNDVVKVVEEDKRSVVAGGHLVGWTQEVAVVLWQRMLGSLGDINNIENPEIHAQVYDYLCDLLDLLCKVSVTTFISIHIVNLNFSTSQFLIWVFNQFIISVIIIPQIRDNIGVTKDNQSSPVPPEFLPPILHFVSWLFDVSISLQLFLLKNRLLNCELTDRLILICCYFLGFKSAHTL